MYTEFEATLLRIEIKRLEAERKSPEQQEALRRKNKELRAQEQMRSVLATVRTTPIFYR